MRIRVLEHGDPALSDVEQVLMSQHGRDLAAFGVGPGRPTVVLGSFDREELVAFAIFGDYRDPRLHIGSHLRVEPLWDVIENDEVALYQIALLHSEAPVGLRDTASALIQWFEQWLRERFARYCLFITLMRRANRKARPLYRELGFKPAGRASYLMRFDLKKLEKLLSRIPALPEELLVRFFDEATEKDRAGFRACYREVFLADAGLDEAEVARVLEQVTSEASSHLSMLLLRRADQCVVGFMLAEAGHGTMHIGVAGLMPEVRGQHLPYRCLPPVARRAFAHDIRDATFVTTHGRVARLTMRAFGAHEIDQLQTHLKVG